MKRLQSYKAFTFAEVTKHDVEATGGIDSKYVVGDILVFRPGDSRQLGYEDIDAGSVQEAKDFVDSDEETISRNMIIVNHRKFQNGNGFILGVSGSGKSRSKDADRER